MKVNRKYQKSEFIEKTKIKKTISKGISLRKKSLKKKNFVENSKKMVVLETGGSMVTINNTQYLQPDYLSPLPTTVGFQRFSI